MPEEEPRAGYPTKHVEVQVVAVNDAGESNHGRSFDPERYGAGRQAGQTLEGSFSAVSKLILQVYTK